MNVIDQAEKVIESLHLPLSYDDDNNEIVTSKVETEYGEYGSELYKYRASLIDGGDKRSSERVIEALHLLLELTAECKARQDRITQLQQDNHRLHEHELLLDGEVKRLNEAAKRGNELVEDLMANCNALRSRAQKAEKDCVSLEASSRSITDAIGCEWSQDEAIRSVSGMNAEAARWQAAAKERAAWAICAMRLSGSIRGEFGLDEPTIIEEVTDEDRQQAAAALGQPRAWRMSEERIEALQDAADQITGESIGVRRETLVAIQAMLVEAKQ